MTNEDLIKTSAVAGAVGFGLSSIYHAKQNKPYDDRSKTIYESLVDCYLEHIASPIPPEWEVRKEEGKIKPINCVKDIDVVKDLARRFWIIRGGSTPYYWSSQKSKKVLGTKLFLLALFSWI